MGDEAKKDYEGIAVPHEKALTEMIRVKDFKARMQRTANDLFKIGSISQSKTEKGTYGSKFSPTVSVQPESIEKPRCLSSRDDRMNMKCIDQDESFWFWSRISERSFRNSDQNGVPYASYRLGPSTCLFFPGSGMQSDFCYWPVIVVVYRLFFKSSVKFICFGLSVKLLASKMQFRPKILSKSRSNRRRQHFRHDCLSLHSVGHRCTTSSTAAILFQLAYFCLEHEGSAQNFSSRLDRNLLVLYFREIFLRVVTRRKCMLTRNEFAVKWMEPVTNKPECLTAGDSMSEITPGLLPSTALHSKGTTGGQADILRKSASAEVAILDLKIRVDQLYTGMFAPDTDSTLWFLQIPLDLRVFCTTRCDCYVTNRRLMYDDPVCNFYPEQSSFNCRDDLMSPALTYNRRPQSKHHLRPHFRSTPATYSVHWCGSASTTPTSLQRINFNNFNSFHEEPVVFLNGCVVESGNKQRENRVSDYGTHHGMGSLYDNTMKEMQKDADEHFEDIMRLTSESGSSGDESPHPFIMADCGQHSMPRYSVIKRTWNGSPNRIGTEGVGTVIYRSKRLRASSANEGGRSLTSSQYRKSNGRSSILRPSSSGILRCKNDASTTGEDTMLTDHLPPKFASDKNSSLERVCLIQNSPPPHYARATLASRQMILQRQIDHLRKLLRSTPLANQNSTSHLKSRSKLNVFDDGLSSKEGRRRYIRRANTVKRPKTDCPLFDLIKQGEVFQPDYKSYSPFHKDSFDWQWDSMSWPRDTPEYQRAIAEPRSQRFLMTGESKKLQTLKSYPDGLPLRPVRGTKYLRIQSALSDGPHHPANSSWNKLGSDHTHRSHQSTSRIRSSSLQNPVSRSDGLFMSRYSLRSPIRPLLEQTLIQKGRHMLDEASSTTKGNKEIRKSVRQVTPTELLKTTSAKQINKESEMKAVRTHLTEPGLPDNIQACFPPSAHQCLWGSVRKKLGDVLHSENGSPDINGLIRHSWSPEPTKNAFHIQPPHQQEHESFLHITRSSTATCGDASDSPTQMYGKSEDLTDRDESKGTMKLLEELLTVPKSFTVGDSANIKRKLVAYQARMPTNRPKVEKAIEYLTEQADHDQHTSRHGLQISYETDQTLIKEKLETVSPLGVTSSGTRGGCLRKIQPSTTRWHALKLSITISHQSRQQLRKYHRFNDGSLKTIRNQESSVSIDLSGMESTDVRYQGELVRGNDADIITTRSDSTVSTKSRRSINVVIRRTNNGNLPFSDEMKLEGKTDLQAWLPEKADSEPTCYKTFTSTGVTNSEVFVSEYVDPEQTAAENPSIIEYVEPEPVSLGDIDLQSVVDTTQLSIESTSSVPLCSDIPSRIEKVYSERTVHKYQSSVKNADNGPSDGKQSSSQHVNPSVVIRETKFVENDKEGEDCSGIIGKKMIPVQGNHDFPKQSSGNSDKFHSTCERKISTSTSVPNSPVRQSLTPTVRHTKVTDEIPQIPSPCYHLLFKNAQIRSSLSSPLALITGLSNKPANQIKGNVGKLAVKQRSEDINGKSDKHPDRFGEQEKHHHSPNTDGPVETPNSEEHKSAPTHFPSEQLADKVRELELQSPPSEIYQSEKRLKSGTSSSRQKIPEGSNMSDLGHGGSAAEEQQKFKERGNGQSSEPSVNKMGMLKLDYCALNEPQPGYRPELMIMGLLNTSHGSSSELGCLEQSADDLLSGSQAELLELEHEPEGGSGLQQMFLCTTSGPLFVGQQPKADDTNLEANLHPLVTKTQKTACSTTSSVSSSGKIYSQFQLGSLPFYENRIMKEIEKCWQYCGNNRGPIKNVNSFLRGLRSLFLLTGPQTSVYDTLRKLFSFYRTDLQSVLEGGLTLTATNGEIYYQLTRQWAVAYLTEEKRNSCSTSAKKTGMKEELFGLYIIFLLAERLSLKASELLQKNEFSLQDSDDTDQASKIFQKYIWSASQPVRYPTQAKDDSTILKDELCFIPPAKYPLPSLYQRVVEFLFTISGNEELQRNETSATSAGSRALDSLLPTELSSRKSGITVRAASSDDLRKKQSSPYSLCSSQLRISEHTRWKRPSNLLDEKCSASEGKTESAVHSISYSSEYLGHTESVKPNVLLLIDPPNSSCRFLQKTTPLKPVECLGYGRDKIVQEGGVVLKLSVLNSDVVSSHEQLTNTVVTDQNTYTNDTIIHYYSSKNMQSIGKVSEPESPHYRRPTLASSVATVSIPKPPSFVIKFQRDAAHREARVNESCDHVEVNLLNQELPLNGYQGLTEDVDTSGHFADRNYGVTPKEPIPHRNLGSPVYRQDNKTNEFRGTTLRRNILARAPAKKSHPSTDQTSNRKISRSQPLSHERGFISSNDNNMFHDEEIKSHTEQSISNLMEDGSVFISSRMSQKIHPEHEQQRYHSFASIYCISRTSSQTIGSKKLYSLDCLPSTRSAEQSLNQGLAVLLFMFQLTSTFYSDTPSGVQEEQWGKTRKIALDHPTHPTEKCIVSIFARRFARVLKSPSKDSFRSPSLYVQMSRKHSRPTTSSSSVRMNMKNSFTENNRSSYCLILKNTIQQPEYFFLNALTGRIKEDFVNKCNISFKGSDIQEIDSMLLGIRSVPDMDSKVLYNIIWRPFMSHHVEYIRTLSGQKVYKTTELPFYLSLLHPFGINWVDINSRAEEETRSSAVVSFCSSCPRSLDCRAYNFDKITEWYFALYSALKKQISDKQIFERFGSSKEKSDSLVTTPDQPNEYNEENRRKLTSSKTLFWFHLPCFGFLLLLPLFSFAKTLLKEGTKITNNRMIQSFHALVNSEFFVERGERRSKGYDFSPERFSPVNLVMVAVSGARLFICLNDYVAGHSYLQLNSHLSLRSSTQTTTDWNIDEGILRISKILANLEAGIPYSLLVDSKFVSHLCRSSRVRISRKFSNLGLVTLRNVCVENVIGSSVVYCDLGEGYFYRNPCLHEVLPFDCSLNHGFKYRLPLRSWAFSTWAYSLSGLEAQSKTHVPRSFSKQIVTSRNVYHGGYGREHIYFFWPQQVRRLLNVRSDRNSTAFVRNLDQSSSTVCVHDVSNSNGYSIEFNNSDAETKYDMPVITNNEFFVNVSNQASVSELQFVRKQRPTLCFLLDQYCAVPANGEQDTEHPTGGQVSTSLVASLDGVHSDSVISDLLEYARRFDGVDGLHWFSISDQVGQSTGVYSASSRSTVQQNVSTPHLVEGNFLGTPSPSLVLTSDKSKSISWSQILSRQQSSESTIAEPWEKISRTEKTCQHVPGSSPTSCYSSSSKKSEGSVGKTHSSVCIHFSEDSTYRTHCSIAKMNQHESKQRPDQTYSSRESSGQMAEMTNWGNSDEGILKLHVDSSADLSFVHQLDAETRTLDLTTETSNAESRNSGNSTYQTATVSEVWISSSVPECPVNYFLIEEQDEFSVTENSMAPVISSQSRNPTEEAFESTDSESSDVSAYFCSDATEKISSWCDPANKDVANVQSVGSATDTEESITLRFHFKGIDRQVGRENASTMVPMEISNKKNVSPGHRSFFVYHPIQVNYEHQMPLPDLLCYPDVYSEVNSETATKSPTVCSLTPPCIDSGEERLTGQTFSRLPVQPDSMVLSGDPTDKLSQIEDPCFLGEKYANCLPKENYSFCEQRFPIYPSYIPKTISPRRLAARKVPSQEFPQASHPTVSQGYVRPYSGPLISNNSPNLSLSRRILKKDQFRPHSTTPVSKLEIPSATHLTQKCERSDIKFNLTAARSRLSDEHQLQDPNINTDVGNDSSYVADVLAASSANMPAAGKNNKFKSLCPLQPVESGTSLQDAPGNASDPSNLQGISDQTGRLALSPKPGSKPSGVCVIEPQMIRISSSTVSDLKLQINGVNKCLDLSVKQLTPSHSMCCSYIKNHNDESISSPLLIHSSGSRRCQIESEVQHTSDMDQAILPFSLLLIRAYNSPNNSASNVSPPIDSCVSRLSYSDNSSGANGSVETDEILGRSENKDRTSENAANSFSGVVPHSNILQEGSLVPENSTRNSLQHHTIHFRQPIVQILSEPYYDSCTSLESEKMYPSGMLNETQMQNPVQSKNGLASASSPCSVMESLSTMTDESQGVTKALGEMKLSQSYSHESIEEVWDSETGVHIQSNVGRRTVITSFDEQFGLLTAIPSPIKFTLDIIVTDVPSHEFLNVNMVSRVSATPPRTVICRPERKIPLKSPTYSPGETLNSSLCLYVNEDLPPSWPADSAPTTSSSTSYFSVSTMTDSKNPDAIRYQVKNDRLPDFSPLTPTAEGEMKLTMGLDHRLNSSQEGCSETIIVEFPPSVHPFANMDSGVTLILSHAPTSEEEINESFYEVEAVISISCPALCASALSACLTDDEVIIIPKKQRSLEQGIIVTKPSIEQSVVIKSLNHSSDPTTKSRTPPYLTQPDPKWRNRRNTKVPKNATVGKNRISKPKDFRAAYGLGCEEPDTCRLPAFLTDFRRNRANRPPQPFSVPLGEYKRYEHSEPTVTLPELLKRLKVRKYEADERDELNTLKEVSPRALPHVYSKLIKSKELPHCSRWNGTLNDSDLMACRPLSPAHLASLNCWVLPSDRSSLPTVNLTKCDPCLHDLALGNQLGNICLTRQTRGFQCTSKPTTLSNHRKSPKNFVKDDSGKEWVTRQSNMDNSNIHKRKPHSSHKSGPDSIPHPTATITNDILNSIGVLERQNRLNFGEHNKSLFENADLSLNAGTRKFNGISWERSSTCRFLFKELYHPGPNKGRRNKSQENSQLPSNLKGLLNVLQTSLSNADSVFDPLRKRRTRQKKITSVRRVCAAIVKRIFGLRDTNHAYLNEVKSSEQFTLIRNSLEAKVPSKRDYSCHPFRSSSARSKHSLHPHHWSSENNSYQADIAGFRNEDYIIDDVYYQTTQSPEGEPKLKESDLDDDRSSFLMTLDSDSVFEDNFGSVGGCILPTY